MPHLKSKDLMLYLRLRQQQSKDSMQAQINIDSVNYRDR